MPDRSSFSLAPLKGTEAKQPLDYINAAVVDNASTAFDNGTGVFFEEKGSITVPSDDVIKWDKLYPYQLAVLDAESNYAAITRFTLPIPPTDLNIQTPIAINNTITMGGVVEEHNGAPTKIIQLSGTTGVFPLRKSTAPKTGPSIAGGSISATLNAANELGSAATDLTDSVKSLVGKDNPVVAPAPPDNEALKSTGYYQFRLLQSFLENYLNIKKQAKHKNKYLAITFYKEGYAYLVSPVMFNVRRSASSPLAYNYDLQLKAFKRIPLSSMSAIGIPILPRTKSLMEKIVAVLENAYKVAMKAIAVIRGVRQDIQSLMDKVRSAILAVKGLVDAAIALVNLPANIIKDFRATIINSWNDLLNTIDELKSAVTGFSDGINQAMGKDVNKAQDATPNSGAVVAPHRRDNPPPNRSDDMFARPNAYVDFFAAIPLDNLYVDERLSQLVQQEKDRVAQFNRSTYQGFYNDTMAVMANLGNALGGGDSTFDATYGITEPHSGRAMSEAEFTLLSALGDIADGFAQLASNPEAEKLSTIDYIAGYAAQAGIAFKNPVSKYAVPFPYDTTLEQLAKVYLGDPDRWLEIAALNGLREPYVDEVGFTLPLLSNGSLATILVSDVSNLRISQPVWLQSDSVFREKRHIVNIVTISPTQHRLTLDGAADLDKFTSASNAYLQAYLPDTVNSLQLIYIPSDEPGISNDQFNIPGVDAYDQLLSVSGVDLLLTNNNDLAITPDGDIRFAYGMANIIQYIRTVLATPKGALLRHPTWGLDIKVGTSIADTSAIQIAKSVRDTFKNDPAFEHINSVNVAINGPVAQLTMNMNVYGLDRPLDVAIQVTR